VKDGVHLYAKIARKIRLQIDSGKYNVGDRLPPERKLCEEFEVSRITIRQALNRLQEQKVIDRQQGKGTFVLPSEYNQLLDTLYSFKDEIEKSGQEANTRMLDIDRIKVDAYLNHKMGLPLNSYVYRLSRLRLANNIPLVLEYSFIPFSLAPELDRFNFSKVSLYETLNSEYSIEIDKAYETLNATKLTADEADILKKEQDDTAMYIERFAYTNDQIIEFTRSLVIGDKYKYTVELI